VNSDNDEDELLKGDALIRANFHIDPTTLDEQTWPRLCSEAIWIETWRLKCQAEMLARLFGAGKN
jgi:hypothetical protein